MTKETVKASTAKAKATVKEMKCDKNMVQERLMVIGEAYRDGLQDGKKQGNKGITFGKFFKYTVMISVTAFLLFIATFMVIGGMQAAKQIKAEGDMTYTGEFTPSNACIALLLTIL